MHLVRTKFALLRNASSLDVFPYERTTEVLLGM